MRITNVVCDNCGNHSTKKYVYTLKSYFDGHRNEIDAFHLDLCDECREKLLTLKMAYEYPDIEKVIARLIYEQRIKLWVSIYV